jgi:hypothetical protein
VLPDSLRHLKVDRSQERTKDSRALLTSDQNLPMITNSRVTLFETNQSKDSSRLPKSQRSVHYRKDALEVQDVIRKRFVRARKDEYRPILDETAAWINKNPDNFLSQKLLRKLMLN